MNRGYLKNLLPGFLTSIMLFISSTIFSYDSYSNYYDNSCECENQFWIDAEYLYWQICDSPKTTVLVTESPTGDAGSWTPVIGGNNVKYDWRSGGRFAIGY